MIALWLNGGQNRTRCKSDQGVLKGIKKGKIGSGPGMFRALKGAKTSLGVVQELIV